MPRISLTDFVDIVSKSGIPKATNVAKVNHRPGYEPATDFYKPLRDRITETHRNNLTITNLEKLLPTLSDNKKIKNYPAIVKGCSTWWGKKGLRYAWKKRVGWLTQAQLAELFDVNVPAVSKHVHNILKSVELEGTSTVSKTERVLIHVGQ